MNDAARRMVAHVAEGKNALVAGDAAASCAAIEVARPGLAELGTVVFVDAGQGELSLSSLLAQVAEDDDLGGQDDVVLELGFRRLTGPGRTVLVLQAPGGISRSALRYVQHVQRQAPNLPLVATGSEALGALLAEPAFAALQTRLVPVEVEEREPFPVPALPALLAPERPVERRRRYAGLWVGAVVLVAAASASGAFLLADGQRHPRLPDLTQATASLPLPASMLAPDLQRALPAPLAVASPARLASLATPAMAETPPGERAETVASPLVAAYVPTAALPPLLPPPQDRSPALRRPEPPRAEPSRVARSAPVPDRPHYREPTRYAWGAYPEPPPEWRQPPPWHRESPYLGTYAVDPYGMRVFRYEP